MRRGTTPTLTFTTPYAADLWVLGRSWITFEQRGTDLFSVRMDDESVTVTDSAVTITLTQEQTLAMTTADKLSIQLRGIVGENKAVGSNVVQTTVCGILKDGEI